jgi:hypothetical protein
VPVSSEQKAVFYEVSMGSSDHDILLFPTLEAGSFSNTDELSFAIDV